MAEFSKCNYCLHGAESVSSKRPVCLQMMAWTLYDDDDPDSSHIHVCIKLNPQQPNAKMLLSGRMLFLKTTMWVLLDCRVFRILKWRYWGMLCFALFCHGLCRLALGLQSISKTVSKYLGLTVPFNNIQPAHIGEKKQRKKIALKEPTQQHTCSSISPRSDLQPLVPRSLARSAGLCSW